MLFRSENYEVTINESGSVEIQAANYYYNFGTVWIGNYKGANFTLRNNSKIPWYINSIYVNGNGFWQDNNCPNFLLKGHACKIRVTFAPQWVGFYNGVLKINLTGGQDINVWLKGRGVWKKY